ncbi:hypothetical protein D3C76_1622720 [compost metagenome]
MSAQIRKADVGVSCGILAEAFGPEFHIPCARIVSAILDGLHVTGIADMIQHNP